MSLPAENQGAPTVGGTPETPDTPQPIAVSNRLASLDIIRGIAVLGILAANIIAFGQPMGAYMYPDAFLTEHGSGSDWLWVAQFVLVDGKMRGLFTLLFGAGLALFMQKAEESGSSRWLQVRRLCWLLIFGLLHYFLLWRGDILTLYALLGFVALGFVHWPRMNLLVLGLIGYGLGALVYLAALGTPFLVADTPLGDSPEFAETREGLMQSVQDAAEDDEIEAQILTKGSYGDFVSHNFSAHLTEPLSTMFLFVLETLPLMLIGMALFKYGLFNGGPATARWRIWAWLGVIGGSLATLLIALWVKAAGLTYWGTLAGFLAFSHLPRLPVVLGLAVLLALWGARANGFAARRFAAAGRMAFSNYLGTSMLMVLVFHPWAGGLWGKLTRPELYLVVVITWLVILGWSRPWLAHFRYGPLEWLWRCLTYWRIFELGRHKTQAG